MCKGHTGCENNSKHIFSGESVVLVQSKRFHGGTKQHEEISDPFFLLPWFQKRLSHTWKCVAKTN